MRLKKYYTFMLSFSIALISGCAATSPQKQSELFRRGSRPSQLQSQAQVAPSVTSGKKIRELDEKARARVSMLLEAGIKKGEGEQESALKLFLYEEALKLAPELWETHYDIGLVYAGLGDTMKAEAELLESLRYGAPTDRVYSAIGMVFYKVGDKGRALKAMEKSLSYGRNRDALINAANMYLDDGNHEKALKYYREAEILDPDNNTIHFNVGTLLYKTGNYRGALERFSRVQGTGADYTANLLSKAQTLVKLKEYDEAIIVLQGVTEINPSDPYPYKTMGIIYEIYLGEIEKAVESYKKYIEIGNKSSETSEIGAWIEVLNARIMPKE